MSPLTQAPESGPLGSWAVVKRASNDYPAVSMRSRVPTNRPSTSPARGTGGSTR